MPSSTSYGQEQSVMFEMQGIQVRPGERAAGKLDVTALATGLRLEVPVHVVAGAQPGPTLLVMSTAEGEAIATILTVRDLLAGVAPGDLSGTLLVVPVMNLPAFETQSEFTQLDGWSLDEAFPSATGGMVAWARGWATQQIASTLAQLVDAADYAIDLRAGTHHLASRCVRIHPGKDVEYTERVRELSRVYGLGALYEQPVPESSLADYAALANVPLVTAEFGGGHPFDAETMADGLRGILNVMRHLGMLQGGPELPTEQKLYAEHRLIRTRHGGMFYPGGGTPGGVVGGGTVLGTVVHAQTLKEIERIVAPYPRTRLLKVRSLFSAIHPGDVAFLVANEEQSTEA